MRRLREEYREAHGRDPDDRHVAAALGIDHTKVRVLGRAAREVASLDASALLRGGPRKGSGAAERFAPRAALARIAYWARASKVAPKLLAGLRSGDDGPPIKSEDV